MDEASRLYLLPLHQRVLVMLETPEAVEAATGIPAAEAKHLLNRARLVLSRIKRTGPVTSLDRHLTGYRAHATRLSLPFEDYLAFVLRGNLWCSGCHRWQPNSAYAKNPRRPTRRDSLCRECQAARHRTRYLTASREDFPERLCACGCGEYHRAYDAQGILRFYALGHRRPVNQERVARTLLRLTSPLPAELVVTLPVLAPAAIASALRGMVRKGLAERTVTGRWRLTRAGRDWLAEVDGLVGAQLLPLLPG